MLIFDLYDVRLLSVGIKFGNVLLQWIIKILVHPPSRYTSHSLDLHSTLIRW